MQVMMSLEHEDEARAAPFMCLLCITFFFLHHLKPLRIRCRSLLRSALSLFAVFLAEFHPTNIYTRLLIKQINK